jgi:phosphopantothenoylcysteine decarboxylase
LTQEELADRANVSRDLAAKLEQGRRRTARITSLASLAGALDVELSALVRRVTRVPENRAVWVGPARRSGCVSDPPRWLYLVVSAAPPMLWIEEPVVMLTAKGWSVCVIATPTAASWIDLDALAATTGCLTQVHPRRPREQDSLPRADAVVAAPTTFNSINKWAARSSDTLGLGLLNELLCTEVPIVAVPCVKAVLREHPAYADSVARLTSAGVAMLDPDAVKARGEEGPATFDWLPILSALDERVPRAGVGCLAQPMILARTPRPSQAQERGQRVPGTPRGCPHSVREATRVPDRSR